MKQFGYVMLLLLGALMLWFGYEGIQSAIRLSAQGAITTGGSGSFYVYLETILGAVALVYGVGGLAKNWDRKVAIGIAGVILLVEFIFSGLIAPIALAFITAAILAGSYKFSK